MKTATARWMEQARAGLARLAPTPARKLLLGIGLLLLAPLVLGHHPPGPPPGHPGRPHPATIVRVDEGSLTERDRGGWTRTLVLTPLTRYHRGPHPIDRRDLAAGQVVATQAAEQADGSLVAADVDVLPPHALHHPPPHFPLILLVLGAGLVALGMWLGRRSCPRTVEPVQPEQGVND